MRIITLIAHILLAATIILLAVEVRRPARSVSPCALDANGNAAMSLREYSMRPITRWTN